MEIDKFTIDMIVRKLSNNFNNNLGVAYLVGKNKSDYSVIEDVSFPEQISHQGYVELGEDEQVKELENIHLDKVFNEKENKFHNDKAVMGVVQYNADYDAKSGAAEKDIFDEIIFLPCIKLIVNRKGEYSLLRNEE